MSEMEKLTGRMGWSWRPYPSEDTQALHDVLVVGRVQRFYDDGPCYGEALGMRTGPISTDAAARARVESTVIAALARPASGGFEPTHRHKKRGSLYRVIGEAEAQVSRGRLISEDGTSRIERPLCDGCRITVYQAEDGKLWARFTDEFEDGRFEELLPGEGTSAFRSLGLLDARMANHTREITHSALAERCAYLAKVAAAWAGDLLSLPELYGAPVPAETIERLLTEMRERLDRIELAGGSGNG